MTKRPPLSEAALVASRLEAAAIALDREYDKSVQALYEPDNDLKRAARALALLRQSMDERIRYWAEWHDDDRQLSLPFPPIVDHHGKPLPDPARDTAVDGMDDTAA